MMISPSELKEKLNQDDVLIIDVREKWEYEEQNIGAKNIPLAKLPEKIEDLADHKSSEIIVHCQSGKRSNQAMKYLCKHGFSNVKSVMGGLKAYLEEA